MRIFDLISSNNTKRRDVSEAEHDQLTQNTQTNPRDIVKLDIPLLLRLMEYSREDAGTDMDLHHVTDKLIELSATGQTLTMSHYNKIVSTQTESLAPAEKLVKDIEYDPDEEEVEEGHGRYWCSTDKRWKERKGTKQSRG